MSDNLRDYGIEIELTDPSNFLIVKETLTRMGVGSIAKKTLWQSCHILHKQGKYYIIHFQELLALDGKRRGSGSIDDVDIQRRNRIALMLQDWNLIRIVGEIGNAVDASSIFVISHSQKDSWDLVPKYTIGK